MLKRIMSLFTCLFDIIIANDYFILLFM